MALLEVEISKHWNGLRELRTRIRTYAEENYEKIEKEYANLRKRSLKEHLNWYRITFFCFLETFCRILERS